MMLRSAAARIARRLDRELPILGRRRRDLVLRRRFAAFQRLRRDERLPVHWSDRLAILDESTATTSFDRHHVYHVAWAIRVLAHIAPGRHVDIGSSLYFVAASSAFTEVEFYDYRPADLRLDRVSAAPADLVALPFADASVPSLSCMHVVEHVGLGRYGDPLDPDGDIKAMEQLARVLAPGGSLLFVVPVGRPRVVFNAHRVYAFEHVRSPFVSLELAEFALVPDDPRQGLIRHADTSLVARQQYGCGCFWFRRPLG